MNVIYKSIFALGVITCGGLIGLKRIRQNYPSGKPYTKIIMGQADLGFVYRTDAIRETNNIHMIDWPISNPVLTQTWIALNTESDRQHSTASIVYNFLTESDQARGLFEDFGFQTTKAAP